MKERLLSMIRPMVLATRATAKTQTRRVVKFPDEVPSAYLGIDGADLHVFTATNRWGGQIACPYGKPGDVLGIREAAWMWCVRVPNGTTPKGRPKWKYVPVRSVPPVYCADRAEKPTPGEGWQGKDATRCWRWKAPRFLPRWAVRTRVEIVQVRVERLQDISEADAQAEGVEPSASSHPTSWSGDGGAHWHPKATGAFCRLWDLINAERGHGWAHNDWVWVVVFKLLP